MKELIEKLTAAGIEHTVREHPIPLELGKPQKLYGANQTPLVEDEQVIVGEVSIIKGYVSFDMYELLGIGKNGYVFKGDRYATAEEVIERVK